MVYRNRFQGTTELQGDVTCGADLTVGGDLTFGDAAIDTLILKGRVATMTAAGSAIDIDSTYPYGEGMEYRWTVSDWAGVGSSWKGMYVRAQADLGGAYGLRGAEFYSVMNTSTTTGLSSLQNVYAEMLIKASASSRTLTNGHCIEANISVENQTGTLTFTNNIYALYAKIQSGTGIADYTKLNGIKIGARDDGTARVFGIALDISDPEATVCTWTRGISLTTASAVGVYLSAATTQELHIVSTIKAMRIDYASAGGDSPHAIDINASALAGTAGLRQGAINLSLTRAADQAFAATWDGNPDCGIKMLVRNYADNLDGATPIGAVQALNVQGRNSGTNILWVNAMEVNARNDGGAISDTVRGLHIRMENYGTISTSNTGLDIEMSDENYTGTQERIGILVRNTDASGMAAVDSIMKISHTSTYGFTYLADLSGCDGANGSVTSDSGTEATTWKARIKVKTDDGTDGWVNVYSTSNEA